MELQQWKQKKTYYKRLLRNLSAFGTTISTDGNVQYKRGFNHRY